MGFPPRGLACPIHAMHAITRRFHLKKQLPSSRKHNCPQIGCEAPRNKFTLPRAPGRHAVWQGWPAAQTPAATRPASRFPCAPAAEGERLTAHAAKHWACAACMSPRGHRAAKQLRMLPLETAEPLAACPPSDWAHLQGGAARLELHEQRHRAGLHHLHLQRAAQAWSSTILCRAEMHANVRDAGKQRQALSSCGAAHVTAGDASSDSAAASRLACGWRTLSYALSDSGVAPCSPAEQGQVGTDYQQFCLCSLTNMPKQPPPRCASPVECPSATASSKDWDVPCIAAAAACTDG